MGSGLSLSSLIILYRIKNYKKIGGVNSGDRWTKLPRKGLLVSAII
jgi:hypothetical protein